MTVAAVAGAFGLGPDVIAALRKYAELLAGWTAGNVTGLRHVDDIERELIADALALLQLPEVHDPDARWADLGAGAGIPGIPLALACPGARLTLVESIARKCTFLEEAVTKTGLRERATVVCARSELLAARGAPGRRAFALVLARAVGPLPVALELAAPLLAAGGRVLVATSEQRATEEREPACEVARRCGLLLERVEPLRRSPLASSVCVVATASATLPDWLPRRPGRARTHPLARG